MYFRHLEDATAPGTAASPSELTRRQFLKFTTLAGTGLTLGILLPGCARPGAGAGAAAGPLEMPFVHIAPDNTVTVLSKHLEAGQGVWTGLPAIVAEELDASWEQMRVASAPAEVPLYGNLAFGGKIQATGGSTAIANSWQQLRQAGATARAMLLAAAAKQWNVPAAEITVSEGVVSHAGAGRKASFGELAGSAAREPVPTNVALKDPTAFRIVGNEKLPRLDTRAKSTGKQQFAIDVMLPGMMTAVVMRPPRFGGKVSSFDATKAKAVPGVVEVVQIPRGVAVVARDMWSAKKGRDALTVTWDESAAEKRGTGELMKEYRALGRGKEAVTVTQSGDVEAALAHAAKRVEGEFEFPYLAHATMEPLTAVARLSPDKCEIWAGCQFQTIDQGNAAAAVGLKPEQVSINTLAAGGTFGRRANAESDYISEVASIARATGGKYPVRLIWTREDDITGGRYRPLNYHRSPPPSARTAWRLPPARRRPVDPRRHVVCGHDGEERRRSDASAPRAADSTTPRRCTRQADVARRRGHRALVAFGGRDPHRLRHGSNDRPAGPPGGKDPAEYRSRPLRPRRHQRARHRAVLDLAARRPAGTTRSPRRRDRPRRRRAPSPSARSWRRWRRSWSAASHASAAWSAPSTAALP